MAKSITDHFKPYLTVKGGYKGGKTVQAKDPNQKSYKLSSNENPIGASPMALAAMEQALAITHIYPDPTDARLRDGLAEYYDQKLDPDQFVCAPAGSEVIELLIRAFVKLGDEVIYSSPYFVPYRSFSLWAGAKVIDIPLFEQDYSLDVQGIINAVTDKTRIIFLTSPNNPTGTYIKRSELLNLVDQVPKDILVVYDEVYWHFVEAGDYSRAIDHLDEYKNLVGINSFSKTFGLAGLRVGYGYMSVLVADYLRQICKPFLISRPAMEGALSALKDDTFIQKTIDTVIQGRNYLSGAFDQLGIQFVPSQANFFLIEPPIPSAEFVSKLAEEGVSVRPTDNFGAPGKVRISVGTMEANERLINVMKGI